MATKIDDFIKRVESTAEEDFFTQRTFYHLSSSMFHEMCELLKKQEPKSPVVREKSGYWDHVCPTCGSNDEEIGYEWNYCPFCGQALKWGE